MKIKYQLTFLHKLFCIGLLVTAVLSFLHTEAYYKKFTYGEQGYGFSYLQQGEYVLDVYCVAAPVSNEIIVYSQDLVSEDNLPGVELLRVDIGKSEGNHRVTLVLEQDTYNVNLRTAQDGEGAEYIEVVSLQSVQLQNKDNYLMSLLCVLCAVGTLLLGWYVPVEKYKEPLLLVCLGLAASMPLFSDFMVSGDDLGFHVARLEAVYRGLQAGEFPVYLGSTQMGGYGTLSAIMYPQLFLYPFAFLRFTGASLMLCYKMLLVCMHVGSAFAAYYSGKHMCNSAKIGFWASVLYTFSMYRLTNTYFRGALGETLAMVFLPLVIWGIYEILWGNDKKWYLLAIGVGGLLQSHVSSVAMCVLFLLIELAVWLVHSVRTRGSDIGKRVLAGMKAVGMTGLVNAFFLVPFLYYRGEDLQCFDMPNQLSVTVVYFSQMFSLFAGAQGYDMGPGSTTGEMPLTVGAVLLLGAVLLCVEASRTRKATVEIQVGKRCLVYGAIALLLTSWIFPWDKVQNLELLKGVITALQFAWRFFGPASALLSIAAAVGLVRFAENGQRKWVYGVFAALVICSTSYFFTMKGTESVQIGDKMEFEGYGYTDAMYMYSDGESFKPLNLDYNRTNAYIVTMSGTEVTYEDLERKGMQLSVTTKAKANAKDYLLFPFYYYPGYEILIDGEKAEVLNLDFRVACELPGGTADIEVYYKGLPGFVVANWTSVLTIGCIVMYNVVILIKNKRREER